MPNYLHYTRQNTRQNTRENFQLGDIFCKSYIDENNNLKNTMKSQAQSSSDSLSSTRKSMEELINNNQEQINNLMQEVVYLRDYKKNIDSKVEELNKVIMQNSQTITQLQNELANKQSTPTPGYPTPVPY